MDSPLVFLTTNSDTAPSGRNARAVARASMVRRSGPSTSARGTFHSFPVTRPPKKEEGCQSTPPPKSCIAQQSRHPVRKDVVIAHYTTYVPRVLGPQSIAIHELLLTATTTIREDLASSLDADPSRFRDYLRRRQWAAAAFALDTLKLTPEVYTAVRYLEYKICTKFVSEQSHTMKLRLYGNALSELQQSLRHPERRMQPGILAASHILALCELLDDSKNNGYLNFVTGIVVLSTMQARTGDQYARAYVHLRAGAILVDALLTRRYDVVLDQPWSHVLISAGEEGHISSRDALHFADTAKMLFDRPNSKNASMFSGRTDQDKVAMAAKARGIHSVLKQTTQKELLQPVTVKYTCPFTETVGERMAVMLALEDFVSDLKDDTVESSELIQHGGSDFYTNTLGAL